MSDWRERDLLKDQEDKLKLPGPEEGLPDDVEPWQVCSANECFTVIIVRDTVEVEGFAPWPVPFRTEARTVRLVAGPPRRLRKEEGSRMCDQCERAYKAAEEEARRKAEKDW